MLTDGREIERLKTMVAQAEAMKLKLCVTVHYDGYGRKGCPSRCRARIFSDTKKAVVILTELPDNPGVSVTNDYERIASNMRGMVTQFIPRSHFPSKVVWMEQYAARPEEIDLVTLQWEPIRGEFSLPHWHRLNEQMAAMYDVPWQELTNGAQ